MLDLKKLEEFNYGWEVVENPTPEQLEMLRRYQNREV
jgi:hypothetical protein